MRISRRCVTVLVLLVLPALILGVGLSQFFAPEHSDLSPTRFETDPAAREDQPLRAPNDWFFAQRASPCDRIPIDRWRTAEIN